MNKTEMEYSSDQLNYFRVCFLVRNIITNGVRSVFKTEWNTRYKASLGEWQDKPKNGQDFWNQERPKSQVKKRILDIIKRGDMTKEWDCTVLFSAILYSNSIGGHLSSTTYNHVDGLREFRNEVFHALPEEKISDSQFQDMVKDVESMFTGLSLSTDDIKDLASQKQFPTEELRDARDKIQEEKRRAAVLEEKCEALEEKCEALEGELMYAPKSFVGSLPPKPSHVVKKREREVSEIIKKFEELSQIPGDSTVYLSGNPGCGKSQLARQIAEDFYKPSSCKEEPFFVATLNGANHEQMIYSYHKLSRDLGCTEYAVSKITGSRDLTPQQKLKEFKCLTAPKLKDFPSWLIIVDNVVDLAEVREYWPTSDCIQDGVGKGGNIIVTTQDYRGIPECGPKCHDFRLSSGMRPHDAVNLLNNITKSADPDNSEKVAQVLDWQPLAIACAGLYLCNVRAHGSPQFGWKDYLEKLNEGKEEQMGKVMEEKETFYRYSMFKAVKMAVERAVENEEVLFHSLHFLSVCAPSPIPLEVVVQFVRKRTTDRDDQEIRAKIIDCCLLQFDRCDDTLSFHQIVHRVIKREKDFDFISTKAFQLIAAALEPVELMADDKSSRKKLFVEHVSAFLSYVTSVHSAPTNFYAELNKVVDLGFFFGAFTSCAETCLNYRKMAVVKECYELVRKFIEDNGCMEEESSVSDKLSAWLLSFSGRVMVELSEFKSAMEFYNKSLSFYRNIYGGQHSDVATVFAQFGGPFTSRLHQLYKSESCFQQALSIYLAVNGDKHESVATCLLNLGAVNTDLHRYKEAESFIQRAMSIYREVCGENSEQVARCLFSLGRVNRHLCKFNEAEKLFIKARDMFSDIYGSCHPLTAGCLTDLGLVYLNCCRYNEARDLFEQSLRIYDDAGDQYGVALCLHSLGLVCEKLLNLQEAVNYFNSALKITTTLFPEGHPLIQRLC